MRRGEIWTVSGGRNYAGKGRAAVILQDDSFSGTASITICAFTTDPTDAPLFRLPIATRPTMGSGPRHAVWWTKSPRCPKTRSGKRIGRLSHADIVRLNQAIVVFLGLATSPRTGT